MKQPSSNRRSKARAVGKLRRVPHQREGTQARFECADALAVLEALAGSIEAPADWSAEHDHYLYGTPKRAADPR